ncbi:mycothiol transferase [uncultured Cellulomonas sp.]|uniref:mycothiol transferase n=1 Tax=uncultured Cellulomonas sp. TaxID=189682 RepID=UPI00263A104D|nr:DinB family protein [uncultured Cellulomonas sp.]
MLSGEVLADGFGRIREVVRSVLDGLDPQGLAHRPSGVGNSVGWLVWHLARVQDDHLADAFDADQVWTSQGWVERFGLPFDPTDTGYGHDGDQVAAVQVDGQLLLAYLEAVHARTAEHLSAVTDEDLDRVVDASYDPPVTLGVRLVSVLSDDLQHAGQAAYVRGLLTSTAG